MTFSFYEQHQSIALQLKINYTGTGEGETKYCAKCCLKMYMTQNLFVVKEHQTLERLG